MKTLPFSDPFVRILGPAWLEEREQGLIPHRLPAEASHMFDMMTGIASATPSGVRVALRTSARSVELELLPTVLHLAALHPEPPAPVVDLVVDGEIVSTQPQKGGRVLRIVNADLRRPETELVEGDAVRFRFDDLPGGDKDVELWLPPFGRVELRALRVDAAAELAAPADRRRRWIHYGSSISQCSEASSPARIWPAIAARRAGLHLHSLGLGGSCHLDPFVARYIGQLEASVITLKLGINVVNLASFRERTFVPAVHGFLDLLRDAHPRLPIAIVSPIYCPSVEAVPGPTVLGPAGRFVSAGDPADIAGGALTLMRIRELLAAAVDFRRGQGDPSLHYLDGLELFGEADAADLPDDLHPNGPGYERMGERFAERVFGPGGLVAAF